jgi:2-polyprenyl-6-methoxyphenol hydroxylase-like FAD-dependent oxidoreductase
MEGKELQMGQRHAEIAGAGMVGLTAAAALARRGWSVTVHERHDELRELGAGLSLWDNGGRALMEADAYEEAVAGSDDLKNWQLRDHKDRLLQDGWMAHGTHQSHGVLRPRVHNALANAARRHGVEIVTGSKVVGATPEGEILLADGTRRKADLVIGADGVNSPVRSSLHLAKHVRELPDGGGRHLIPRLPGDPKNVMIERWNGGRRIGILPCTENDVYIYLCCPADDFLGRNQTESLSTWIASFPEYEHYIRRIRRGPEWRPFTDVVVKGWHKGRAAIVGDAASAMSPNLGQAGCVGMSNAVALAQALDEFPAVEEALTRWEQSERPITDATQKYSRFYGWIGTNWPRPLLDLRSALIWGLARSERMQARINAAARHIPQVGAPHTV